MTSDRLTHAVAAWIGCYNPVAPPHADLPDVTTKRLPFSTKSVASACVLRAPNAPCPEPPCATTRTGRCVVSRAASEVGGEYGMNNAVTADEYRAVRVMRPVGASQASTGAPAMWSSDARALLVPFRTGSVRHRDVVMADARAYEREVVDLVADLESAGRLPRDAPVVLCGHSQGGVLAQAVAIRLASAATEGARDAVGVDRVFVLSSGAHLWMREFERRALERAYRGRLANFVLARPGWGGEDDATLALDWFASARGSRDGSADRDGDGGEDDDRRPVVPAEATVLVAVESPGGGGDEGDEGDEFFEAGTCAIPASETSASTCGRFLTKFASRDSSEVAIHPWEFYRPAIEAVYGEAYARLVASAGGGRSRRRRAADDSDDGRVDRSRGAAARWGCLAFAAAAVLVSSAAAVAE